MSVSLQAPAYLDMLGPGKYNFEMPDVLAAYHYGPNSSKPATQYKANIMSCAQ